MTEQPTSKLVNDLEKECFKYLNWTIEILHEHNLWDEDGTYTFEDGETIRIFDPYETEEDDVL